MRKIKELLVILELLVSLRQFFAGRWMGDVLKVFQCQRGLSMNGLGYVGDDGY